MSGRNNRACSEVDNREYPIDPRTELPILGIPESMKPKYPHLLGCLILLCKMVKKVNQFSWGQDRLLIITDDTVYFVEPSGEVRRCIQVSSIEKIYIWEGKETIGLLCPFDYDLMFKSSIIDDIIHVIRTLYRLACGVDLPCEMIPANDKMSKRLELRRPKDWEMCFIEPISIEDYEEQVGMKFDRLPKRKRKDVLNPPRYNTGEGITDPIDTSNVTKLPDNQQQQPDQQQEQQQQAPPPRDQQQQLEQQQAPLSSTTPTAGDDSTPQQQQPPPDKQQQEQQPPPATTTTAIPSAEHEQPVTGDDGGSAQQQPAGADTTAAASPTGTTDTETSSDVNTTNTQQQQQAKDDNTTTPQSAATTTVAPAKQDATEQGEPDGQNGGGSSGGGDGGSGGAVEGEDEGGEFNSDGTPKQTDSDDEDAKRVPTKTFSFGAGALKPASSTNASKTKEKVTCTACGEIITGKKLDAAGSSWHPGCFRCDHCDKPFTGPFMTKEGKRYHKQCLQTKKEAEAAKCPKCSKPILGKALLIKGEQWHTECFVCSGCGKGFDGPFVRLNELPYHKPCALAEREKAKQAAKGNKDGIF